MPHLENFPVTVGVKFTGESGTTGRTVFREQSAGLESNAASVAESLRTEWTRPPLRGLLYPAVATPANLGHFTSCGVFGKFPLFRHRCRVRQSMSRYRWRVRRGVENDVVNCRFVSVNEPCGSWRERSCGRIRRRWRRRFRPWKRPTETTIPCSLASCFSRFSRSVHRKHLRGGSLCWLDRQCAC